jgi:hypothetical protein
MLRRIALMDRVQKPTSSGINPTETEVTTPAMMNPKIDLVREPPAALAQSAGIKGNGSWDKEPSSPSPNGGPDGEVRYKNTALYSLPGYISHDPTAGATSCRLERKGKGKASGELSSSLHSPQVSLSPFPGEQRSTVDHESDHAISSPGPPATEIQKAQAVNRPNQIDRKGKRKAVEGKSSLHEGHSYGIDGAAISTHFSWAPLGNEEEELHFRVNRFDRIADRVEKWRQHGRARPTLHESSERAQPRQGSSSDVVSSESIDSSNTRSDAEFPEMSSPFTDFHCMYPHSYCSCNSDHEERFLHRLTAGDWEYALFSNDPESKQLAQRVRRLVEEHFNRPPRNEVELGQHRRSKTLKLRSHLVIEWVPYDQGDAQSPQDTRPEDGTDSDGYSEQGRCPESSRRSQPSAEPIPDEPPYSACEPGSTAITNGDCLHDPDGSDGLVLPQTLSIEEQHLDGPAMFVPFSPGRRPLNASHAAEDEEYQSLIDAKVKDEAKPCGLHDTEEPDHDVNKAFLAVVRQGSFNTRMFEAQIVPGAWPPSVEGSAHGASLAVSSHIEEFEQGAMECILPLRPRFHQSVEDLLLLPGTTVDAPPADVLSTGDAGDASLPHVIIMDATEASAKCSVATCEDGKLCCTPMAVTALKETVDFAAEEETMRTGNMVDDDENSLIRPAAWTEGT